MNEPEIVTEQPVPTAVVRGVLPLTGLTAFFDESFRLLPRVITAQGVTITGAAFALYRAFSPERVDLEVGFTTDRALESAEGVVPASLPGGRIARVVHTGGFEGLSDSWERLRKWLAAEGLQPGAAWWEVYLTQPSPELDPAELRTELNWPLVG